MKTWWKTFISKKFYVIWNPSEQSSFQVFDDFQKQW